MAKELFDIMSGTYQKINNRMANALPKTLEDAKIANEKGTAEINVPDKVRSIDWLKENGVCIDNIAPFKSRIIQAGQGAFATRKIKKGEIVTPVPVVQIRREDLEIYDAEDIENPTEVFYEGRQILLNYCFGHNESSVLLFPYAPTVNYVNHHRTKFNVELQWSSLPNHKSSLLNMRPRDLANLDSAGLIMDMVATRDIEVGEEVYLDYGASWERQWNEYVAAWEGEPETFIPAWKLNQQVEWLRTTEELQADPYPPTVLTVCWIPPRLHHLRSKKNKPVEWRYEDNMFNDAVNIDECEIVTRETEADADALNNERDSYRPPDVRYTIVIRREDNPGLGPLKISGVPRTAIMFLDTMYTNNQYVRGSFRHEIGLPDHLVPDVWRDLRQTPK